MGKITQADVEDMKRAKATLTALQNHLGASGGAADYLKVLMSTGTCFGNLDGNGPKISEYINARTSAVNDRITVKGTGGVATAISLLEQTITNYETHENKTKQDADDTPAGTSRTGGSGGSGSSGGNNGSRQGGMG